MEVQVTGFESDGVALISPLDLEFDSRVDALSPPGMADVVKYAKPYVVLVSNKTPRKIVALTTLSSNFEGTAMPNPLVFSYPAPAEEYQIFIAPDAVGATGLDFGDRSEPGILPSGQRIIGLGFGIPAVRPNFEAKPDAPEWNDDRMWKWVVSATRDLVERIRTQGVGSRGIRIKLDAVIFDNGLLIGPDSRDLLRRNLEGHINARQNLYRKTIDRLDQGARIDELLARPHASFDVIAQHFLKQYFDIN